MSTQIVTIEDLDSLKRELVEIKTLIMNMTGQQKKWIRTKEAMEILDISESTLQSLRIKGEISYSKLGGVVYYEYEEILNQLVSNKKLNH